MKFTVDEKGRVGHYDISGSREFILKETLSELRPILTREAERIRESIPISQINVIVKTGDSVVHTSEQFSALLRDLPDFDDATVIEREIERITDAILSLDATRSCRTCAYGRRTPGKPPYTCTKPGIDTYGTSHNETDVCDCWKESMRNVGSF